MSIENRVIDTDCSICGGLDFLRALERGDAVGPKDFKLSLIEQAVAGGCLFCTLLLRIVRETGNPLHRLGHCKLEFSSHMKTRNNTVQVVNVRTLNQYSQVLCPIFYLLLVPSELTTPCVDSQYSPGKSTGSAECKRLLHRWLADCRKGHEKCRDRRDSSEYVPSRLLDLTPDHTSHGCLALIDSSTIDTSSSYACLSHCWGSYKPVKLDHNSYGDLQKGIHLRSLPPTYAEAAQLCLDIGIRYLWIDSMCIFQDSDDDWKLQASQMRHIFKFSALTIAASHAPDALAGLFHAREANAVRLPAYVSTSASGDDYSEKCVIEIGASERPLKLAPLLSRAWAFQECLLTPRIVHFTESEILWHCRERTASETFPISFPSLGTNEDGSPTPPSFGDVLDLLSKSACPKAVPDEYEYRNTISAWHGLCNAYSQLDLTKPADKCWAIAGLALEFQALTRTRYVAGFWERDLEYQLHWRSNHGADRLPQHGVPSWSWLSISKGILLPIANSACRKVSTVAGINLQSAGHNSEFGPLKQAELILDAVMFEHVCEIKGREGDTWIELWVGEERTLTTSPFMVMDSVVPKGPPLEYHFLILSMRFEQRTVLTEGLLLKPTAGPNVKEYHRVGVFTTCNEGFCHIVRHKPCQGKGCAFWESMVQEMADIDWEGGRLADQPEKHQEIQGILEDIDLDDLDKSQIVLV